MCKHLQLGLTRPRWQLLLVSHAAKKRQGQSQQHDALPLRTQC